MRAGGFRKKTKAPLHHFFLWLAFWANHSCGFILQVHLWLTVTASLVMFTLSSARKNTGTHVRIKKNRRSEVQYCSPVSNRSSIWNLKGKINCLILCMCADFSPDTYIQKTKKSYIDSRARRNLGSINTELQDVQRIMVANIEEVLQRGEALSGESVIPQLCSGLSGSHH